MTATRRSIFTVGVIALASTTLVSCATSNPNAGRVLLSISVTPATANAATYPNGQVTFTATGTFSLSPSPAPIPSTAPYTGQILVSNPTNPAETIATVVATGNSTATVQCAPGASGTVPIVASASANNDTGITVTGSATLTCP